MAELGYILAPIIWHYWILIPLSNDTHNDPFGRPGGSEGEATGRGERTKGVYGYQIQ